VVARTGFERVPPADRAIAVAQAGQKRDPVSKLPGIWRMSDKQEGGVMEGGKTCTKAILRVVSIA